MLQPEGAGCRCEVEEQGGFKGARLCEVVGQRLAGVTDGGVFAGAFYCSFFIMLLSLRKEPTELSEQTPTVVVPFRTCFCHSSVYYFSISKLTEFYIENY